MDEVVLPFKDELKRRQKLNALLKAVCKRPDDDKPRLKYAEMLEATGNHDDRLRAEFIRVQCELAKRDIAAERSHALHDRMQALEPNRFQWAEDLPALPGIQWESLTFQRGFVADIWCDDEACFRWNAKTIFTSAPIQGLVFLRIHFLDTLLEVPEIAQIKRIIMESCGLGPADARLLAASPKLVSLAAISLRGNQFSDDGVKALAQSPHLRKLQELDLGKNRIGNAGVAAMAASPHFASLTCLALGGNPITNDAALALASSPYLKNLNKLNLAGCNKIGVKGKRALLNRFSEAVSFEDEFSRLPV